MYIVNSSTTAGSAGVLVESSRKSDFLIFFFQICEVFRLRLFLMGLAKRLNPLELSVPFMNYVARQLCHVLVIEPPTQFIDAAPDSGFAEDRFFRVDPGLEPLEGGEDCDVALAVSAARMTSRSFLISLGPIPFQPCDMKRSHDMTRLVEAPCPWTGTRVRFTPPPRCLPINFSSPFR
jgi:hypothetical protein